MNRPGTAFCLILLWLALGSLAQAHDCSGPDDCEETSGYLTTVGVAGGVIAIVAGIFSGLVNENGAVAPGRGSEGDNDSGQRHPPGSSSKGPPLIDPDTGEALLVHDGSYEDGKPGDVWSPWEGWVSREVAEQHVAERNDEIAQRNRELADFERQNERDREDRLRQRAEEHRRQAEAQAAAQAQQDRLNDLRRRGEGYVNRVDDPVRAAWLQDFLDRHENDPDALERALNAVRDQTFEADQQRNLGAAEAAVLEEEELGRGQHVASATVTGAKAAATAVGTAMVTAGTGGLAAAAAATGAIGAAGAGTESALRGDNFTKAAVNTVAAGLIGAGEGALNVGSNLPGTGLGTKMLGQAAVSAADHVRRTGDVKGGLVTGGISALGAAAGHSIDNLGNRLIKEATGAAAATAEGAAQSVAQGGSAADGAAAGLESWGIGRVAGGIAGHASQQASDAPPPIGAASAESALAQSPNADVDADANAEMTFPAAQPDGQISEPPRHFGVDSGDSADPPSGMATAAAGFADADSASQPADHSPTSPTDADTLPDSQPLNRQTDSDAQPDGQGSNQQAEGDATPESRASDDQQQGATPTSAPGSDPDAKRQSYEDMRNRLIEEHGLQPDDQLVKDIDDRIRDLDQQRADDSQILDPNDPSNLPEFEEGAEGPRQGAGISAEEAERQIIIMNGDGTVDVSKANPLDSLQPNETKMQIDPHTGKVTFVHGDKVPNAHKTGIEARLMHQNRDKIDQAVCDWQQTRARISEQTRANIPDTGGADPLPPPPAPPTD